MSSSQHVADIGGNWYTYNRLRLFSQNSSVNIELPVQVENGNVSVNSNWVHPPGNPREIFLEGANHGHPGKYFCLIPCPGAKNDGQISRGWGKIFPNSKKLPLKACKKSSRNSENYETVKIFCLENLTQLLYFRLKQNHSKVFKYSASNTSIEIMNIYVHKYIMLKGVVHLKIFLSFAKV